MFKEFKKFISRGNAIDLAIAVVMGSAFTGIVRSLVNDIVGPILGIFLGGIDFSNLSVTIGSAAIKYGSFLQAIINFLIIAAVIFIIIKAFNAFEKRVLNSQEMQLTGEAASSEVKVLREIRDILKKEASTKQ